MCPSYVQTLPIFLIELHDLFFPLIFATGGEIIALCPRRVRQPPSCGTETLVAIFFSFVYGSPGCPLVPSFPARPLPAKRFRAQFFWFLFHTSSSWWDVFLCVLDPRVRDLVSLQSFAIANIPRLWLCQLTQSGPKFFRGRFCWAFLFFQGDFLPPHSAYDILKFFFPSFSYLSPFSTCFRIKQYGLSACSFL